MHVKVSARMRATEKKRNKAVGNKHTYKLHTCRYTLWVYKQSNTHTHTHTYSRYP